MDISVIVPLYNEEQSLPELEAWINRIMVENNYTYEVIMIDDGSTDNSWAIVQELHAMNSVVKGIRFQRNYGKSAALNEGFKIAKVTTKVTTSPMRFADVRKRLSLRFVNRKKCQLFAIGGFRRNETSFFVHQTFAQSSAKI